MITEKNGKVVKGLGGLFDVRIFDTGEVISCRAKGNLKRDEDKVLVGDNVTVTIDDSTPDGIVISAVKERSCALIRPPMANLDYLFIVFAAAKPSPVIETVDKLISIAEHHGIEPVVVITKSDIGDGAEDYEGIYRLAGLDVFVTSSESGEGTEALSRYIEEKIKDGKTAAFAGASGVGKSTLMNKLFPNLSLKTAEISRKIERGRHTTRQVDLFALSDGADCGYIADTPGFSMLDFERFDFMECDDLPLAMREFAARIGECRYTKCSHTKEEGCAIVDAVKRGEIPKSRHESFCELHAILKAKKKWDKR